MSTARAIACRAGHHGAGRLLSAPARQFSPHAAGSHDWRPYLSNDDAKRVKGRVRAQPACRPLPPLAAALRGPRSTTYSHIAGLELLFQDEDPFGLPFHQPLHLFQLDTTRGKKGATGVGICVSWAARICASWFGRVTCRHAALASATCRHAPCAWVRMNSSHLAPPCLTRALQKRGMRLNGVVFPRPFVGLHGVGGPMKERGELEVASFQEQRQARAPDLCNGLV